MSANNETSNAFKIKPIKQIAEEAGIDTNYLELYGNYKAKVNIDFYNTIKDNYRGKLIFVTCITPTPAGEGKTLTSIGLTEGFGKLNKKVHLCLREPSLGPVFGTKGGATGSGRAQLYPMDDINLHFTGDLHAITSAHNLMAAVVDNHIFRGNSLDIDVKHSRWRRVVDMNDRVLRTLEPADNKLWNQTGFDITAASEIMAILALSENYRDLKRRLSRVIVAYNSKGQPVWADQLGAVGSQAVLLKDAMKPNLVQTIEGQPAFVHCGPFANIAHGNSSVIATKMALSLADYVITEGGFAADLGAEKFFDIVCPNHGLKPDVAVLVCSVKALNMQGGAGKKDYNNKNLVFLDRGLKHLRFHIDLLKQYGIPVVVAINRFDSDSEDEINLIEGYCRSTGVSVAISRAFSDGGNGTVDLAKEIIKTIDEIDNNFQPLYNHKLAIKDKINTIARNVYKAKGVIYSSAAKRDMDELTHCGFSELPICMAKTQFSISDDASIKGVPEEWKLNIRQLKVANGAGFIVAIAGNVMLMPGLPKKPAAQNIYLDDNGNIIGLR